MPVGSCYDSNCYGPGVLAALERVGDVWHMLDDTTLSLYSDDSLSTGVEWICTAPDGTLVYVSFWDALLNGGRDYITPPSSPPGQMIIDVPTKTAPPVNPDWAQWLCVRTTLERVRQYRESALSRRRLILTGTERWLVTYQHQGPAPLAGPHTLESYRMTHAIGPSAYLAPETLPPEGAMYHPPMEPK